MRLQLDPIAVDLAAQVAGAAPRRVVSGLAVPYEIEARIGRQLVTFAPDSIAVEGSPPLLLGHDANRPVGVLSASSSEAGGLRATYSIDQTADGDTALVQAQSGSRRGLSVGADVLEFEEDPENPDRIRVTAARLAETSLVAMAAYGGAGVDTIAAQKPAREGETVETKPPEAPEPEPETDDDDTETTPAEPESRVRGERSRRLVIADRGEPEMRFGEYIQTLVKAERGDQGARVRIEAALNRGNLAGNPGVVPIAYVTQVIDSLEVGRPLFDAMTHAEMPASGMTIRRPEVTGRPDGNFLADDTAGAPSNPVTIANHDVTVKQWAWGGSASVALVERSSPSYVEEVFAQAIKAYYRDVEADIAAAFVAVAAGTATSIGGAIAQYLAAYRDYPDLIVCGGDAYGKLLDATGILMLASGSADAKGNARYAGLEIIASPDVTAGDAWVCGKDFQEVRESTPIRLSVSDVTSLSLEIGVTSFYARTQLEQTLGGVAGAVHLPAFVPPPGTLSAGSSSRK